MVAPTGPDEVLAGATVRLRPPVPDDMDDLVRIRSTPEVYAWWRGDDDLAAAVAEDLAEPARTYVIELEGGRPSGGP